MVEMGASRAQGAELSTRQILTAVRRAITKPVEAFGYEEGEFDSKGNPKAMNHGEYCWMNSAYVMGTKLTDAVKAKKDG